MEMNRHLVHSLCRRVLDHGTMSGDAECLAAICLELLNERTERNTEESRSQGTRDRVSSRSVRDHHRGGEVAWDFPLTLSAAGRRALAEAVKASKGDPS
jgi:hypothetical protein